MKVQELSLRGLKLLELPLYRDERGYFIERFNREKLAEAGIDINIYQINHSRSTPGVIRGLHLQHTPMQGKLVGVTRGRAFDVAVDLRPQSQTFGQHLSIELDSDSGKMLWIPGGFAHGFCSMGPDPLDFFYAVDASWNALGEMGIRFDDPELAICWPVSPEAAIVSDRDRRMGTFAEFKKSPPLALSTEVY